MTNITDAIKKTLIWFTWNALFGLAPFLFMLIVNDLTNGKAENELINLTEGGAVLFVTISITGSVVVDILLGDYGFRNLNRFLLEISPFIMLGFVLLIYLLIVLKQTSSDYFKPTSCSYIFVIIFSIVYCYLAKYTMYIREKGGKHDH